MMHKTCSINYGHLADLQKTLPTTDLNKKKTFHLINYLLATFIFFLSFQSVLVSLLRWLYGSLIVGILYRYDTITKCFHINEIIIINILCISLLVGNYAYPVYGVATICHQVRWLRWGHPSLFHTATSLLIWFKMFCVRDISYRLIWMEFINMFSVYAQSGTHNRFNWLIIVVLTSNPSVLMCVEITDAPKL